MPLGIVRQDLNSTGASFRKGNPVPATSAAYDSNPVTWSPTPAHFGNVLTTPVNYGNVISWTPSPAHFGNILT